MRIILLFATATCVIFGQDQASAIRAALSGKLHSPDAAAYEMRAYLMSRAPAVPRGSSPAEWTAEGKRIRAAVLRDVIFHGWPVEWVESAPKFEQVGPIVESNGYRWRKLRYEVVPGFQTSAVLYEPLQLSAKMPAVLDVHGHTRTGKASPEEQKRCINQAMHGMLALSLDWIGMGETAVAENNHFNGALLDLAGVNDAGLFYLAMRRGLDYLWAHPNVDRNRVGMTGLSGGGWQTITLSALDERIAVSVPVAGYTDVVTRVERAADTGDLEQNSTDLYTIADYPALTGMRAPRPTLIIHNAEDDCCFRAPLVKPHIFDAVKPFFHLYGADDRFAWHENRDPGTHNYEQDNRNQSLKFFARQFGLPAVETETPVDGEVKTLETLAAGIPADNLTIVTLARKLAAKRAPAAPSREDLMKTVRYRKTEVSHAWAAMNTKSHGVETYSYRLQFANGLSATAVLLRSIGTLDSAPVSLVVHDAGKASALSNVAGRLALGEQVLAVDLLFVGDCSVERPGPSNYAQMISSLGERTLGLQAAQILATAAWIRQQSGRSKIRIETSGIRTQTIGHVAVALEPSAFSEVVTHDGQASLRYVFDKPIAYAAAPELFCLDLYKKFDFDSLEGLAKDVQFARPAI